MIFKLLNFFHCKFTIPMNKPQKENVNSSLHSKHVFQFIKKPPVPDFNRKQNIFDPWQTKAIN